MKKLLAAIAATVLLFGCVTLPSGDTLERIKWPTKFSGQLMEYYETDQQRVTTTLNVGGKNIVMVNWYNDDPYSWLDLKMVWIDTGANAMAREFVFRDDGKAICDIVTYRESVLETLTDRFLEIEPLAVEGVNCDNLRGSLENQLNK
jgi:hypothetical protein